MPTHAIRAGRSVRFTFDLSAFKGATLSSATMIAEQTGTTDCTTTPDIQAWLTSTAREPTWDDQPTEQTQLPDPSVGFGCPQRSVVWDAPVTQQAAADGTLALALTPTTSGEQFLSVTSTFADGTVSEPKTYIFFVNATAQQASKRAG